MRNREAHIVLDGIYKLPSNNLVRVVADLGGGALFCRYAPDALSAREHLFSTQPSGELTLTERFVAKHGWGPRR